MESNSSNSRVEVETTAYQSSPTAWTVYRLRRLGGATSGMAVVAYVVFSGGGWWVNPCTSSHSASRGRYETPQKAVRAGKWLKVDRWVEMAPVPA